MLGVLMVAVVAQGGAGEPPRAEPEAAEAVMREFFEDVAAERWLAAAARFHPEALERFRAESLEQALQMEAPPPAEAYYPEDMPQAVRDWFDEQRAQHEAEGPDTYFARPPWLVSDSVASMTGVELLARLLEHGDPRTDMRRAMDAQGAPPELEGIVQYTRMRNRIIGSIDGAGGEAFVVYHSEPRLEGRYSPFSGMAVATLRRSGDEWRIWTHVNQSAIAWLGTTSMVYDGASAAPDAEALFRWPEEGAPLLTAGPERSGAVPSIALEVRGPKGERRVALPPDAVDRLIEYLVLMNVTGGREPGAR